MLVVGGVLLTLLTAQAACFGTSLESRPGHLRLEGRLARNYSAGGVAHVGAVEVEPDAAGERLGIVLAVAGVGAICAALGAVVARCAMHSTNMEASTAALLGLVWIICWAWVTKNSFLQDAYYCARIMFHLRASHIRVLC